MWVHYFGNILLGGAGNFIGWSFKNISHSQYIFVQIHSIWLEDLENFFTPGGVKPTAKVGCFHLPLHHVPSHKIYVLPAATTPMKISKILFARSFRYISNTATHIFRRFYFAK
jgi:hypothetical protein